MFSLQNDVLYLVKEANFTVVLAMRMSQKKFHFSQISAPVLVYFHLVLDIHHSMIQRNKIAEEPISKRCENSRILALPCS
jgi:hypothetical protein